MIRKKTKRGAFLKIALVIISLSSLLVTLSSPSVSALGLNDNVVATTAPGIDCSINFNPLTWVICPLTSSMSAIVDSFDSFITESLTINSCTYFDPPPTVTTNNANASNVSSLCAKGGQDSAQATTSGGFYTAWSSFRDIALGLMVIGALVMVISQILGFEMLDAYTVRKVLPRLVIAAIGISLSWQIVQFLVQFANDMGNGLSYLIYSPFHYIDASGITISGGTSTAAAAGIIGAISSSSIGIIGILTFVLVAVVAAFLGFVVIILREMLIVFLAVLSPLAIAMFILPGTSKLWKLWWNTFFKALLMFPLIVGIIAVGRVFAAISSQNGGTIGQFIAFIAYFGPYFIIPMTFKFAGGILATGGSYASNFGKSFGKSMAGVRQRRAKTTREKRQAGDTRLTSGKTGNIYRRVTTSGGLSPFSKGQERFKARDQLRAKGLAENALKQDGGAMAGDDIATGLAMDAGMNGGDFIDKYTTAYMAKNPGVTREDANSHARSALASVQTNFGTRFGTPNMMLAAATARVSNSPGAYTPDDAGLQAMYKDVGSLVKRGVISDSVGAQMIKANKSRVDQSAASFPEILKTVQESAATGTGPSLAHVSELRSSALQGANPSEFIGAHLNSVKALVPQMSKDLGTAIGSGNDTAINRELAKIDSIYTNIASGSPKAATLLSDELLTKPLIYGDGSTKTVRQAIETARNTDDFKNYKASFGPPPSDIRLKENIIFVGIINGYRHYSFNYIFERTTYVGVMAQEILKQKPEAVIKQRNGYYAVNYEMLGLKMYTLSEWNHLKVTEKCSVRR